MEKVNNFDVLKAMGEQNMSIMLCNTITNMDYNSKSGTKVTIGVPGNVIFDIESKKKQAVLLLFDMKQFDDLKKTMEGQP